MAKKPINKALQTKNKLHKIYREFARRRYKKFKLQFPQLREGALFDKIIKTWNEMSQK